MQHHVGIGQIQEEFVQLGAEGVVQLALLGQVRDRGREVAVRVADFLDHQAQAEGGLRDPEDARHRHLPHA